MPRANSKQQDAQYDSYEAIVAWVPDGWKVQPESALTQGHLESLEETWQAYSKEREKQGGGIGLQGSYNGKIVRAAVETGWFAEKPVKDGEAVGAYNKPREIAQLAWVIDRFYDLYAYWSPPKN